MVAQQTNEPFPPFHHDCTDAPPMVMTEDEFRATFHEGQYVEWKQSVSSSLREAVVAFSNAGGGVVQIGVADDGRIVGRKLDADNEVKLHRMMTSEVRDPGRYELHELVVGDKPVIVLSIQRRFEGFAQLPDGRLLVRKGKSNLGIMGQELVDFIGSRALTRFEQSASGFKSSDIDLGLLNRLVDSYGWKADGPWNDRLTEIGLMQSGGDLTIAGALLLVDRLDSLGKTFVEIFRYRGGRDSDYDRRLQIGGTLDAQVENATQAILEELGTEQVVLGAYRHELPRLPDVVVREAIANAVAHRSYEHNLTSIKVSIYPEAVEIQSPGGLPEPVTVANIRETQASRNPAVIAVLRRLRLAEDAGLGVDRMQDVMTAEMLDAPTFEDLGFAVRVTLPITGTVAPRERAWVREVERRGDLRPSDRIALVHAARGAILTNSYVRDLLKVDSADARQILQRLRDAGFLRQRGERGTSRYVLADGLGPPAGLRLDRDDLKLSILDLATEGPITNASVREATGLGRSETKQLLRDLVADGQLILAGEGRGAHYGLAEINRAGPVMQTLPGFGDS